MNALLGFAVAATTAWLSFDSPDKTRDIDRHIAVEPSQRIEINGFSGSNITFSSWDKNEVYVKVQVRIESSDRDYEKEWAESVKLTERQSAGTLIVTLEEPDWHGSGGRGFWGRLFGSNYIRKQIEGEIFVPRSNALRANIPYATVSLEDMKGEVRFRGQSNTLTLRNCANVLGVDNDYGKTTIENSGGELKLDSKSGTVTISDFKGSVDADINYSKATVSRVSKSVSLKSQSATLRFEDIQGDLTVAADYSNITASNIAGFADLSTKSGSVRVKQVKGVNVDALYSTVEISGVTGESKKEIVIKGQSGKLIVEDAVGDLRIDNPYSTMELKKIRGNVNLETKSGRVTGEDIAGNWNSRTEYSSITLRNLSAQQVLATNSSNPVDIELKTVPTKIEIKNDYAGVKVTIPQGFSGDVSLEAAYGNVESNLPIRVKSLGGGGYGVGKIGSGNSSISIETKSGNIRLLQR
jgi:hypothetical protein